MPNRRIVKIFLASPGDLADERKAARTIVDEFNLILADRLNCQIELIGWEQTVSSPGRPQSVINRELEECEFFYGMLWKRWGTAPALDGPYTSGFEEEFRRSFKRYKDAGVPEIKLAFKTVSSELLLDPGKELQKVLDFRDSLIAQKELLFETFGDLGQFRIRFMRAIYTYALQLANSSKNELGVAGIRLASTRELDADALKREITEAFKEQVVTALRTEFASERGVDPDFLCRCLSILGIAS
jgi:hypothetical protein